MRGIFNENLHLKLRILNFKLDIKVWLQNLYKVFTI